MSWDKNEYGPKTGTEIEMKVGNEIGTRAGVAVRKTEGVSSGDGGVMGLVPFAAANRDLTDRPLSGHLMPITTPTTLPVPVPAALRDAFSYSYSTQRTAASQSASAVNYRHRPRSATFTTASARPPGTSRLHGII